MELVKGNVKVEWVDLGGGLSGDYDPDDPDDIELLRFDISYLNTQGDWVDVHDASYCTMMPVGTDESVLMDALAYILDVTAEYIEDGHSVKKLCEELSWISPADVSHVG